MSQAVGTVVSFRGKLFRVVGTVGRLHYLVIPDKSAYPATVTLIPTEATSTSTKVVRSASPTPEELQTALENRPTKVEFVNMDEEEKKVGKKGK
jgi:hypothetical protein